MVGGTGAKTSGRSLLLIVSAVDLLLSAVIGAVLLTVAVMGAFGKGEDQAEEAAEQNAEVSGLAIVEVWAEAAAALVIDPNATHQQLLGANRQVASLMPGARLQSVDILDGTSARVVVRVNGEGVLVVTVPDGTAWVVSVNCDSSTRALRLSVSPHLRFSGCAASTQRAVRPTSNYDRILLPEDVSSSSVLSRGFVRQSRGQMPAGYALFQPTESFAAASVGAWAIPQSP